MVRAKAGYEARFDSLDAVDPAPLAGRRIALDPGHGGRFRGSLGVHGLAEADVNLAVALGLRDLLQAHGAMVFMTRSTDRDFLTPADSSLRADLNERVRLANQFQPDLFVSIHHNADPGGAHDRNETQTYYKLGDDGSSMDAAASIHRYLRRNLSIEAQRILGRPLERVALDPDWNEQQSITAAEKIGACLLMFATLVVGVYPKLLLDRIMPAVEAMRFLKSGG